MTDLATLNTRLAAHRLPVQTAASLAALPAGLDVARIEHALRQVENGQKGALVFLVRHLPEPASGPAPAPETPRRPPCAPVAASASPGTRPSASTPPAVPATPTPATPHTPPLSPAAPTSRPSETGASPPDTVRDRAPTPTPETSRRPPCAPVAASASPGTRPSASTPPAVPATPTPARPHTPPLSPAAPTSQPSETGASPPDAVRDRVQCRVYGGKAALCVETDVTRQDEPTLRIEAALATAPKTYDWGQKITLQLTREELPPVVATLLGLLHRCECRNHGPHNDKGLDIEHQGQHLFIRVFQKGQAVRALPVGPADSYYLAALGLRQLRKAAPWLTDQGVLAALKLTVQRMSAAPPGGQRAA